MFYNVKKMELLEIRKYLLTAKYLIKENSYLATLKI